jgi:type VI secretion system protein ImpA
MLNIEALLAPVSPDQPCGEDLAFSPEVDEIARARLADDPSLKQGAWVTALKEADWKFVGKRCALLIEARSKDLQLGVWLAEASAKTDGVTGLAQGLRLLGALCERYWDGLYPLADEDGCERRIGNLAWIAARVSPLVKGMPVPQGGAATLLAELDACLAALDELERVADARLGIDGPSFSPARAALCDLADVVRLEAGAAPLAQQGAGTLPALRPAHLAVIAEGPVQHREQALAQLRQVAEFFRRTEPHSPVAYLAEKAARWGEQPLHAWLRSVIKDDASLARLDELLGIERET